MARDWPGRFPDAVKATKCTWMLSYDLHVRAHHDFHALPHMHTNPCKIKVNKGNKSKKDPTNDATPPLQE